MTSSAASGKPPSQSNRSDTSSYGIEKELADTKRQVQELLHHIHILTHQKMQLDAAMEGVLSSTSWKLTAPIRKFAELLRAIRPLLRFRRVTFDLVPNEAVVIESDTVRVTGPSPAIVLQPRNGAHPPSGWVALRGVVDAKRYPVFSLLYYRTGGGFNGAHRLWFPLNEHSSEETLAFLPHETKELRLDPFEANAQFTIKRLEVRELGKLQLLQRTLSKHLRGFLKNPRAVLGRIKKGLAIFREGGLTALRARLFADDHFTHNYQEWVKKYDTLTDDDRKGIKEHIAQMEYKPLISLVMPTYNPPERWLRAALDSVLRQLYPAWELCIADDCSPEPHVRAVLEEYAKKDARIKVTFRSENGHISAASNSAAELVTGEFIGLLDHDDEITEHALYMVACELNNCKDIDLLYSDEDKMTTYGMRFNPYFKSDWNPDLLTSQNYVCHFTVIRAAKFREVGGFRPGFDGAQDWDLILRTTDASDPSRIKHIPHVLYHWRVIETSTAHSTGAKPYVMEAQAKSVREHLERKGIREAKVEILSSISQLRVTYPVPVPEPLVSVIIPTKDQLLLLKRCIAGVLEGTAYKNVEMIVVDNGSTDPATLEYLGELARDSRVTVLRDDKPFNYSRLNNDAVKVAKGSILAFLNNDLEVIGEEWLSEMVAHVVRPEVGAVGARLLYPNGLLQHGGVILGIGGVAGHNHKGRPRHDPGYFNRAILRQNLSAVTAACMLCRKEVFEKVGGFEEGALSVAFNDVDLCLKIRREGYLVVYNPHAELYHHESASRGYETTPEKFARFEGEVETMKKRWGALLSSDPYYNSNLTLLTEDFAFAFPPRAEKPWRLALGSASRKAA
jgi:glycosyltransferase involved in cell wall biosynthesis